MSMVPTYILERLHPFYVASDAPDLDAAFAEGQRRYLRSLEREMELVKQATRADYDSAFLGRPRAMLAAAPPTDSRGAE